METKSNLFGSDSVVQPEQPQNLELKINHLMRSEACALSNLLNQIKRGEDVQIIGYNPLITYKHFLVFRDYIAMTSGKIFDPYAIVYSREDVPEGYSFANVNAPSPYSYAYHSLVLSYDDKPVMILSKSSVGNSGLREIHQKRKCSGWIYCTPSRAFKSDIDLIIKDLDHVYYLYTHRDGTLTLTKYTGSVEANLLLIDRYTDLVQGGNIVYLVDAFRTAEQLYCPEMNTLSNEFGYDVPWVVAKTKEDLMSLACKLKGHFIFYKLRRNEARVIKELLEGTNTTVLHRKSLFLPNTAEV